MKISLHIDQIVVEGASLTRREREHLAGTLEQELTRQLRRRAAGEAGAPAGAARQDLAAAGTAALGARIAGEVIAALPAGLLAGGHPARPVRPGRRRSRPAGPGAAR
jgi:hypothetical protein